MTRFAILRCGKLPDFVTWELPNLEELFEEDRLLQRGFEAQGLEALPVVWDEPETDWGAFDAALIRSTWDYLDAPEHFLRVLSQIDASSCALFNPLAAVRWNMNKHYLFDLERWGAPVIPTFTADGGAGKLYDVFSERGWRSAVVKPTVGLGGAHAQHVPLDALAETLTRLRAEQPDREYLVQPFIDAVISEGEWSFVYFNRQFSHALLKQPAPNDYRVQEIYGGSIQAAQPQPEDLRQAEAVLAQLPFDLLYARLDFVRVEGRLAVIEVELIEPIFSFNLVPESIGRLVQACRERMERS